MSKLSPARKLALDVLMEADRRGMYARDVLSSRASAKAIDPVSYTHLTLPTILRV